MPYNEEECDKLIAGPVYRLDNGLVEVGGVYRGRRPTIIYTNPELDFNKKTYYPIEIVKAGELVWVIDELDEKNTWKSYGSKKFQILYNEQIYYMAFSEVYLNKDGPDWERVA